MFILAENVLPYLAFILANQRIGSLYDELCGTVVLLKFEEACTLRILLLEIQDVVNVGTTKRIDTLCIIANDTDTTVLLGKLQHDFLLRIVGVLILVDEHIAKTLNILLADVLMLMKQQIGLHQQVVEVHSVSLSATLHIPIIYMGNLRTFFLNIIRSPRTGFIGMRHQQVVLGH